MIEPPEQDAVGLAALIRAGELRPREVAEAAIRRIEAVNPALNAVVHTRFDEALDEVEAGLPDGPLRGVPIVIKDLGADVAGLPATSGSRLFAENVPGCDSELVARYRRAGMVVLGTTNTPEFGKNASTEPALFGPTRNPWDVRCMPGGSSGGSAAAVASGMVPVAHGSDGGGSIRIPSAMCGLFGLKPSRGRVPTAPHPASMANPLSVHHALSRTVRDSALLLDIACAPFPGAPFGVPGDAREYAAEVEADPGTLRIGYTVTTGDGTAADPQCAAAVERAATICASLGHQVAQAAPDYDAAGAVTASSTFMRANLVTMVDARLAELGRELRADDVEPFTRVMLDYGRSTSAADVMRAMEAAESIGWQLGRFYDRYDLLLTPTMAVRTPELGTLDTTRPETMYSRAGLFSAFTGIFNLTGQPAMSVPAGTDDAGLPLGVQFVAPLGGEALLLRLAGQLERAAPWSTSAPEIAAVAE